MPGIHAIRVAEHGVCGFTKHSEAIARSPEGSSCGISDGGKASRQYQALSGSITVRIHTSIDHPLLSVHPRVGGGLEPSIGDKPRVEILCFASDARRRVFANRGVDRPLRSKLCAIREAILLTHIDISDSIGSRVARSRIATNRRQPMIGPHARYPRFCPPNARRQPPPSAHPLFSQSETTRVTSDILRILWDGPRQASDIIRAIENAHGYRPRLGCFYPIVQMLEDGAFIAGRIVGEKRIYAITGGGSELLATHVENESAGGSIARGALFDRERSSRRFGRPPR
jgi:DNA-binding PadR family transcriptional regulator